MTKIKIKKKYLPKQVKIYGPDDKLIGLAYENQFRDVQVQIHKNKLEGYYVVWYKKKYPINSNGRCNLVKGFLDVSYNITKELLQL